MYLCHKCAGLLASGQEEEVTGLNACSCISGWVRDFQVEVSRDEAIATQVEATNARKQLYTRQGRSREYLDSCDEKLARLEKLKGSRCPRAAKL